MLTEQQRWEIASKYLGNQTDEGWDEMRSAILVDSGAVSMVQVNDGDVSVTLHLNEEAAYRDIVETCLGGLEWIGLDDEDGEDKKVLRKIKAAIKKKMKYEEVYDTFIVDRLEGVEAGFFMEVVDNTFYAI